MKNVKLLFVVICIMLFISGCSTRISKMGSENVYMAYSTGAGFNPANEVANVNEAANKLAKEKNMTMIPLDLKVQQGIMGSTPPSATLQFKLVAKDSKEASEKNNDSVGINKLELTNANDKTNNFEKKLNEIKELLEKGLITKEEYTKMRANLINNPLN